MDYYYDSFDCEICCEEYYGDMECFEVDEEEFEDWHDDCDAWEGEEDSFIDGYWESQTELPEMEW